MDRDQGLRIENGHTRETYARSLRFRFLRRR
jgi:hypothetical protein